MSAKWAKLREIVGEVEEEEPEGETVAGPSGEATIHNFGITPSSFSLLLLIYVYTYIYIYILFFSFAHPTPESVPFFSWADESTDEELVRPRTKEEEDVETLHSWMQVGGFPT